MDEQKNYLDLHVDEQDRLMLDFYYHSLCQPGKVDAKTVTLPLHASPQTQALYYFGLLNLHRFEGVIIPTVPNLLELGKSSGIDWIVAEAKLNRAIQLIESDLLLEGELLLYEIAPQARALGYTRLLARTYRWLGNVKMQRSEIKSSLNYYKMAFALISEQGDDFQATMTLNNIATVYMQSQEWKQANTYIKRALKLYKNNQYSNSLFEAILYANSSAIYFATGDQDKATNYMRLAIDRADKTGSSRIKFSTLSNMSQLYSSVGRPKEALLMAQRCQALSRQSPDSLVMLATCFDAFSSAYIAKKEYSTAIDYSLKTLTILEQSESQETTWEIDILSRLALSHEQLEQYQQALDYLKQSDALKQQFYRQTYNEEIISEKSTLERQLNQREVELLEAQNALQASTLKEQRSKEILYATLMIILTYFVIRALLHLRRSNLALKTENNTDPLTGAYNRRYLENLLPQIETSHKDGHFLLSVVDIDHFKSFNDQYGHDVGDSVLQQTVQRLKQQIRTQDTLVRWGGEEFIVLIPLHNHEAVDILERLRESVESHVFHHEEHRLNVTISIGATICSGSDLTHQWQATFSQADAALYQVKKSGRNDYKLA
ncbi:tetratricopeptide repeat-containing diguanylate cyclase [Vibrio aquaticus]|uniref:tetratricopeptide repeat-containing diguanylate cyclase n=1 Tax=Vibrio aquaticus TaxID=2496559 RepID=UPI001FC9DFD5|nr:diguanylate cyclase [Vibrio aquaticus]